MSDHPQIQVYWYTKTNGKKVYSSAAGAYQVMGYTWNDKDMVAKRKKYKITDYSKENQDKFCIVLFKDKRPGMLDLILQGKIEEATKNFGSYEWASLPPGRYGQPMKTMKEALSLYEKYYKEELNGVSDLHLKKGFLKDFGITQCMCKENIKNVAVEKKKIYDIDKAVAHINNNAEKKSIGKCALYVRQAINAGGIYNLSGHAKEYYDTDKLVKLGFTKIGNDINTIGLKKGDIAAFAAVKGHPYGHIAMYNGTQWVSDFKQKSFWVATQYSVEKKYSIYRWNK